MTNAKPSIVLAITLGEIGGAQNFVLGFARWLQTQGYPVTLLLGDGTWLEQAAKEAGIRTIRLRHMGRAIHPIRDVRAFWELVRVFRQLRPDVVHLNSTKMGAVGSLAARFASVKRVVYRIGGWVFLEPLSPHTKSLYRFVERLSARWKDIIICVHPNDQLVAEQEKIRPRTATVTVANGINLSTFLPNLLSRDEARCELGLTKETFVFGTVAGFYPPKDLPRYIEACADVHKQFPTAEFLIIGDGMQRPQIEAMREQHKLTSVVHLPGHMNNRASRLLRAFDAFVLPSVKEGMPWALLEAMAASLPCIATDVGANAWMLKDEAGWIAPAKDPQGLAAVMAHIIHHPEEAQKRGIKAHETIKERFPLEKTYQGNLDACLDKTS